MGDQVGHLNPSSNRVTMPKVLRDRGRCSSRRVGLVHDAPNRGFEVLPGETLGSYQVDLTIFVCSSGSLRWVTVEFDHVPSAIMVDAYGDVVVPNRVVRRGPARLLFGFGDLVAAPGSTDSILSLWMPRIVGRRCQRAPTPVMSRWLRLGKR